MPKWAERLTHARNVLIVEDSLLDRANQTLVTYTRNVGFSKLLSVEERCVYQSTGGKSTLLTREARIISRMTGLVSVIERFGYERFKHNAKNMLKGIEHTLTNKMDLAHGLQYTDKHPSKIVHDAKLAGKKLHDVAVDAKSKATRPLLSQTQ